MSNSVWPHRRQPIRLPRPWDSPGNNTGVGCCFLLQCMKGKSESEVAQSCLTLSDPMDCRMLFLTPRDLPNPGIKPWSPALQVDYTLSELPGGRLMDAFCSIWILTRQRLHLHFSLSCIGEGNGNPLQCSCLENPRDWGAWWAAVYGVTQSRTRLKRLSSSSSSMLW